MQPTPEELAFAADVKARDAALMEYCKAQGFTDKRTGWTSYRPEQVAHLNPPTNEERSRAETILFRSDPLPRGVSYVAYLSSDRTRITTFTGDTLATVETLTWYRDARGTLSDERGSFRARAIDGRVYRGRHNGPGIYCRMRLV